MDHTVHPQALAELAAAGAADTADAVADTETAAEAEADTAETGKHHPGAEVPEAEAVAEEDMAIIIMVVAEMVAKEQSQAVVTGVVVQQDVLLSPTL